MKQFLLFLIFSIRILGNFSRFISAGLQGEQVREIDLIVYLSQLRRIIKINQRLGDETIDKILNAVDKPQTQTSAVRKAKNRKLHRNILLEIEREEPLNQLLEARRRKIE